MVVINPRLIVVLALIALAFFLLALRYDPQRPLAKLFGRLMAGTALLMGWNLLMTPSAGLNPLSALITGFLGLPGAVLMALLNLMAQQV